MKTKLLIAIAAAGLLVPGIASAEVTRADVRQDRHEVRHERHELERARDHHNWKKARHERRELARAHRKLHHDRHAWRHHHRD